MEKSKWELGNPVLFAINRDWDLPKLIANSDTLKLPLYYIDETEFSDNEFIVNFVEHVRRRIVYLIAENTPADKLMQLRFAIDALKRASASETNLVIPYAGWLRQDRMKNPHESLSAKVVYGDLDQINGVVRFISMDLHIAQATLAVNNPWEYLYSSAYFIERWKKLNIDATVVSADFGFSHTAGYIARKLKTNLAIIDKFRKSDTEVEAKRLIVKGKLKKCVLLTDDIISTFGTAESDIELLLNNGAERVFMCTPHAVLCGPALERIENSPIEKYLSLTRVTYLKQKFYLS